MSNGSAGNMLQAAVRTLLSTMLKIIALIIAWVLEMGGKILFWLSEQIKRNAK
jgi:hypothetical protein